MSELEQLADRVRHLVVRRRLERFAIFVGNGLLPWHMLQQSKKVQWLDIAAAVDELNGP